MSADTAILLIMILAAVSWVSCLLIILRPRLYVQFGGRVSKFRAFSGIEYEAVSRDQERSVSDMPKICFFIAGKIIYFKCAGDVKPFGTTEVPEEVPETLPNSGVLVESVSLVFSGKNSDMRTVIF